MRGVHDFLIMSIAHSQPTHRSLNTEISWPQFMARHDLTWNAVPTRWESGAFIGNGLLGAMIYSGEWEGRRDALRWDINRSDVADLTHRMPIGQMVLQPVGSVISSGDETMHLDLWNAEARGLLKTDKGTIRWRSFTHANESVIVIEMQTTGEESGAKWLWRALPADDPGKVHRKEPIPEDEKNPPSVQSKAGEVSVSTQVLHDGRDYAVAWREKTPAPDHKVLWMSIGYHNGPTPNAGKAVRDAVAAVEGAAIQSSETFTQSHRDWWHRYFPLSFVSLPDTRLESFYWIQMYKLGSATRENGPMLDLMGPWFYTTPWPKIWWNLNVQLTYWPLVTSNRLELHRSLDNTLFNNQQNLIDSVREEWRHDSATIGRTSSYDLKTHEWKEFGNLTWALHNVWMHYRATMDDAMLRDKLYPLLKRSVGYYLHRLEAGADGKLHLPVVISPEYPTEAADTNYDLALLRWGLTALLASNERLNLNDPMVPKWQDTLQNLTPYPIDEKTGLMIGRDVPLAVSHRHFSHLLMIYPLHLMTPDHDRELIEKSLEHWIGFKGALQGYSYTGASSISSLLGRRDDAVRLLNEFLDLYVRPNTMYLELGPVIETPLAGAQSIHDLLLQSWGESPFDETIRVFPGVPSSWRDVEFHDLRAAGGFLVSAARRNGQTQWIRITSLAGEPCHLYEEGVDFAAQFSLPKGAKVVAGGVELPVKKGQTVLLLRHGMHERDVMVRPVEAQSERVNYWGSRKVPPITPQPDGSFDLHASQATIHGDELFYEADHWPKTGTKDNLGHWIDARDWSSWKIDVPRAGRFNVLCTYASPGEGAGRNSFSLQVGESKVTSHVMGTSTFATCREFEIGEIAIDKSGLVDVEVRAIELHGALFNLQRVKLVPVKS